MTDATIIATANTFLAIALPVLAVVIGIVIKKGI